ncbi:hypothetical protein PIB30_108063, partial [Stylosanthes scabra]|nr:hypothetical protein [Stylosanthes scabra]
MSIQDNQFSAEQVNFVNNQPRPPYNDPHSNTYNPGWRNHPNFSWGVMLRNPFENPEDHR